MMRTYVLPHKANAGKAAAVAAVLGEFQTTTRRVQAWQYRRFLNGDGLWNRADPKHIETNLSQRYLRSVLNQTVAGLKSWEAATQQRFVEIVKDSHLDAETKRDLFRINKRKAWYHKTLDLPVIATGAGGREHQTRKKTPIPAQTLKLARRIVKHIKRRRNRLPNLGRSTTMMLDGPVAQFEPSDTDTFNYWVRISTLTKNKPVWIPVSSHGFADADVGGWAALTQVTVNPDKSITVKQVKKSDDADPLPVSADGEDSVGLDFGMRTLFATSAGDLLGRGLYPWLKRIDTQLMTLQKNLQKQGIKPGDSKRYRRFQQRIRAYVRNETNRCLNRLIELYNPAEIVVENLDFRYGGLSKQLNRLVGRAGRKTVEAKLSALHETLGVKISKVPAAHTSRECASCGYVDVRNRRNDRFVCRFCGKRGNADVNAARTVTARRSWPEYLQRVSRAHLLSRLDHEFEARWHTRAERFRTRGPARGARKHTPTTGGLARSTANPSRGDAVATN